MPVPYDALVIALGSVTDFSAVPGMAENAIGLRTLGDAFYLRNRALDMLEEARIETDPARRERLLTFVVVGGGSTGVEVAAELHDLLKLAARSFHDVRPEPRVVLVHSRQLVLEELGERLGRYATRKLTQIGVDLRLGQRLTAVHPDSVELSDGTTIAAGTVVSTVGNAPHPVLATLPTAHDARGWLTPDATFSLPGLSNVWALGDCASIMDPKTGSRMPSTAQHAIREGPHAARNVLAALDGKPQTPFGYGQLGMLVSIGRFKAVGEVLGSRSAGCSPGSCGAATTCCGCPASTAGCASRSTGRSISSCSATSSRSACAEPGRGRASSPARCPVSPCRSARDRTRPTS